MIKTDRSLLKCSSTHSVNNINQIQGCANYFWQHSLVVCKTWAGLNGLGSILGWAGLDFGLGWARFLGLGSVDNGSFR